MPKFFNLIDARLAAAPTGPFLCGATMSIADLAIFTLVYGLRAGTFDYIATDYCERWPRIAAVYDAVKEHPLTKAHGHLPA